MKVKGMSEIADFSVYVEEKIYRLHKSIIYARCPKLLEAEGFLLFCTFSKFQAQSFL